MAPAPIRVDITATDRTKPAFDSATKEAQGFAKNVKELITGAFAVLAAGALGEFFKAAVEESIEAQKNFVDLSVALRNVGANADSAAPQVEALVKMLAGKTGLDPDQMQAAMNRLVVQIGSYKGAMDTLPTVLDVSVARHMSMEQAVTLVSKAYQGNETALKKLGVQVKDGETPFDALRRSYKGFAEEEGQTFAGTLGRIHAAWKDVLEQVGSIITGNKGVADAGNWVIASLGKMATWIEHNSNAIDDFVTVTVKLGQALAWVAGVAITGTLEAWRDLEIIVIQATAGWYEIPQAVKLALGETLDVFASFVVSANGFLNKLGIHIGDDVARNLKSAASNMIGEARDEIDRISETADNAVTKLYIGKHKEEKSRNLPSAGPDSSMGEESKKKADEAEKAQMAAWKTELEQNHNRLAVIKEITAEWQKQNAIINDASQSKVEHNKAVAKAGELAKLIEDDTENGFKRDLELQTSRLGLTNERADALEQIRQLALQELDASQDLLLTDKQREQALKHYQDALKAGGFKTDDELARQRQEAHVTTSNATKPMKPLPDNFGKGLAEGLKGLGTMDELLNRNVDSVGKLAGAFGGIATSAVMQFGSVMADTLLKAIQGHGNLAKAIIGNARMAIAQSAMADAQKAFIDAGVALAHGLMGEPNAFAAAARFAASGAEYVALAAAMGGGGSAGSGGGAGASGGGVNPSSFTQSRQTLSDNQGTGTIIVTGGILDMSNPQQANALANALKDLTGRRIIVSQG